MRDTVHPDDGDPSQFLSWLVGRLSEIPGITWRESPPPVHTSYEDWHVWGMRDVPANSHHHSGDHGSRHSSPVASTRNSLSESRDQVWIEPSKTQKIIARISKHSLRLERQYQLSRELLDAIDPGYERHMRALALIKLPPRNSDETQLTVVIFEDIKADTVNDMRNIINMGPNWFFYNETPRTHTWDPTRTSSGLHPVGHIAVNEFLEVAIGACKCLEMIHQGSRFVHGELRGDSFFYDRAHGTMKIQNFGAGLRSYENGFTNTGWTSLSKEYGIEYKLQFVAPEQTGRSQAQPDARTDIYSLGVLFYNMLTGILPFSGSTPLEVMQSALSKRPAPINNTRLDVPDALSATIRKMLQKNIDQRYQSASGVKHDLRQIQTFLLQGDQASLSKFQPGSKDISPYFILPSALVGREAEREKMRVVLKRMTMQQTLQTSIVAQHRNSSSLSSDSSIAERRSINPVNNEETISEIGSFLQRSVSASIAQLNGSMTTEPENIDDLAVEGTSIRHSMLTKKLTDNENAIYDAPMSRSSSAISETSAVPIRSNRRHRNEGKTDIMLLSGAPGLGKSSLMQDFQPAVRSYGYFCTSKFDISKKIAFEPVLAVLSSLFRQIFSERDLHSPFHQSLRAFIRPVWKVLHTMLNLPEWLLIDGAQELHVERPGSLRRRSSNVPSNIAASKQVTADIPRQTHPSGSRFMAIYLDVLSFLAAQKLIVFCLDDFHLADDDSLDLLQAIVDARIPVLLQLTSNQNVLKPKAAILLDNSKANVTEIQLKPLSEDQVGQYVVATLRRNQEYLFSLIAVIWSKTGGNPFFVREMLSSCYRRDCITYNWKQSEWTYNLDKIFEEFEGPGYDSRIDNDNNFIVARLMDLPHNTRKLISWAAIIGGTFSFTLVKAMMTGSGASVQYKENEKPHLDLSSKVDLVRSSSQDAVRGLQNALSAYIIQQSDDDDHFAFCHDRYQQAAFQLPECKNQKEMHFQVAKAMIDLGIDDRDLFDLSSHICASVDLIKQRCLVRAQYREILFTAASKLIAIQGGRASALNYLTNALTLLQRNPWDDDGHDVDYDETMQLFVQTAETYWLQGFVEPALALLNTSSKKAKTPAGRVPSQILHSRIMARRGDSEKSIQILLQCLSELGITVSRSTFEECDARLETLMPVLRDGSAIKKLLDLSSPTAGKLVGGDVLGEAMTASFWTDPILYYQLALIELELHLKNGNSVYSGLAYIHIATIVVTRFDDIKLGLQLGNAGHMFFAKPPVNPWVYGRVHLLYSLFVGHLERHVVHDVAVLENAVEKSLASGDRFFALVNIGYGVAIKISTSQDFAELEHYCDWGAEEIKEWQDDVRGSVLVTGARQWLRGVCGRTQVESPHTVMNDEGHESEAYLNHITRKSSDPTRSTSIYKAYMLSSLFLFGHMKEAVEIGEEVVGTFNLYWSSRFVVWAAFYYTLATLHLLREEPDHPSRDVWLKEAHRRRDRMIKWSVVNDVNYSCWTKLVTAQLEEFEGHYGTCPRTYEEAIDHAELNSFTFDQALASELYAEFLIRRGASRPARSQLKEAIGTYRHISCFGKASYLAAKHEFLLAGTSSLNRMDVGTQTLDVTHAESPVLSRIQPWQGPTAHAHTSSADVVLSPRSLPDPPGAERVPPTVEALDMIDIAGILRSSQVLASELNVDRLLAKLTKIILESTGAELTAIIVESRDNNTWNVAAISDTTCKDYASNASLEDVETTICTNIALSCLRFKETILADNVLQDERFPSIHDGYRSRHSGRRAVCAMPIFHGQQTVLGCIYIEGSSSFGERCVNFLRLLSSSVSISINNAMLFKRVERVSASNALMVESQKHALAKAREAEKKAKLAEAEALRNVRLKEEAAKAKSLFLANVSHELREYSRESNFVNCFTNHYDRNALEWSYWHVRAPQRKYTNG